MPAKPKRNMLQYSVFVVAILMSIQLLDARSHPKIVTVAEVAKMLQHSMHLKLLYVLDTSEEDTLHLPVDVIGNAKVLDVARLGKPSGDWIDTNPLNFEEEMAFLNVTDKCEVVLYDSGHRHRRPSAIVSFAYFAFKLNGHRKVSVMPEGHSGWVFAGHDTEAPDWVPLSHPDLLTDFGGYQSNYIRSRLASWAEIGHNAADVIVVDVRSAFAFAENPCTPAALNIPVDRFFRGSGNLLPHEYIEKLLSERGIKSDGRSVVVCSDKSSHSTLAVFILQLFGHHPRLVQGTVTSQNYKDSTEIHDPPLMVTHHPSISTPAIMKSATDTMDSSSNGTRNGTDAIQTDDESPDVVIVRGNAVEVPSPLMKANITTDDQIDMLATPYPHETPSDEQYEQKAVEEVDKKKEPLTTNNGAKLNFQVENDDKATQSILEGKV